MRGFLIYSILFFSFSLIAQYPAPIKNSNLQETRTHGSENPFSSARSNNGNQWRAAPAQNITIKSALCEKNKITVTYSDNSQYNYELQKLEKCLPPKVSADSFNVGWILEKKLKNQLVVNTVPVESDGHISTWIFLADGKKLSLKTEFQAKIYYLLYDLYLKRIVDKVTVKCDPKKTRDPKCPDWARSLEE